MKLMATVPAGRIIYTRQALPVAELTGFTIDHGDIVIRTGSGGPLAAAARDAVVAFETDCVDAAGCAGWSVTAIGRARVTIDQAGQTIKITPEIVTGRTLRLDCGHSPRTRPAAGRPGHGHPCTR